MCSCMQLMLSVYDHDTRIVAAVQAEASGYIINEARRGDAIQLRHIHTHQHHGAA